MTDTVQDRRRTDYIRVDQKWQRDRDGAVYQVVGTLADDWVILSCISRRASWLRPFRISRKSVWKNYTPV